MLFRSFCDMRRAGASRRAFGALCKNHGMRSPVRVLLFSHPRGISASYHITDNMDGIDKTVSAVKEEGRSFVFTNLVDFDSKYGHRRDAAGYGKAIESFDRRLPEIVKALGNHDILMLTADHGNDPTFRGTDHTREYIPLLVYSKLISEQKDLGTRKTFSDIGKTVEDWFFHYRHQYSVIFELHT